MTRIAPDAATPLYVSVRRRRSVAALALASAAGAIAWACIAGPGSQDDGHDTLRLEILASAVDHVIAPTLQDLDARAAALRDAAAAWSTAVESGTDPTAERESARAAWRAAMDALQRAEMLQVGPAGSSAFVTGGADVRDEIYSWPTVDACRVDEELTAEGWLAPSFFTDALVNVRGLAAVERLLFAEGDANACGAEEPINQDGSWSALGAAELERRRAAYAAAAAANVSEVAHALAVAWSPATAEFATWLTRPGEGGSPYESPPEALDELFGASMYVDSTVKDRKLAATTAASVESLWAGRSKEHVLANLQGLQALIWAGASAEEGTGFDDLLVALGEPALAMELTAAIDDAIEAVTAIDGSFEQALAADPAALAGAQAAVQVVTDLLKGPVATALRLRPPGEAAGDAD